MDWGDKDGWMDGRKAEGGTLVKISSDVSPRVANLRQTCAECLSNRLKPQSLEEESIFFLVQPNIETARFALAGADVTTSDKTSAGLFLPTKLLQKGALSRGMHPKHWQVHLHLRGHSFCRELLFLCFLRACKRDIQDFRDLLRRQKLLLLQI